MNWFIFHKLQKKGNHALAAASKKQMKAAIRGGCCANGITFDESHPLPDFYPSSPKNAEDVLIKVHAAALNPVDYKAPKALLGKIVGIDVCGTVVAVGENVSKDKLNIGDIVFGPTKIPASGSIAEYAVAESSDLTKVPNRWSVEQAAAVPTVYDTAVTGFEKAGLVKKYQDDESTPPADSILVIGASGGAGMAALHIAKGMGIRRIIGICSAKNAQFCKDNGATEIVPYDEPKTIESFSNDNAGSIDLIYDAATGSGHGEKYSTDPKFLNLLKVKKDKKQPPSYLVLNGSGGHWFRMLTMGRPTLDPRVCLYLSNHSTWSLDFVCDMLKKADMMPVLDTTLVNLTPENVTKGYDMLKSRRTKGKIVIKISAPENEELGVGTGVK